MTHLEIFALYVALNALLFAFLTFRVIVVRRGERVSLGDNDDGNLRKRIRAQANFTETAPIGLLGLGALALLNANNILMHIFGAGLLIGRCLHAHGMMGKNAVGAGRPLGMMLTLLAIIGQAAYLFYLIFT